MDIVGKIIKITLDDLVLVNALLIADVPYVYERHRYIIHIVLSFFQQSETSYTGLKQRKSFKLDLGWNNYKEQSETHWPVSGKHILAHFNEDSVVVYQAFNKEIANYAVEHQRYVDILFLKTVFLF